MMSKPKGLYIKKHERPRRQAQWTPRSTEGADSEGYISDVVVENYGEGNISAERDNDWPLDFESGSPLPDSPSSSGPYPSRAQKYMVDTNSIKDLTGAKFITVPDTKPPKSKSEYSAKPTITGSLRGYGQTSTSPRDQNIPSAYVLPMPRTEGTYQGYPLNVVPVGTLKGNPDKGRASHIATIRLHPQKKRAPHMTTVKAIPTSGVRSVKGYHLGYNATVRGHNTGHIVKQVKQSRMPSFDTVDGTLAFRRTTAIPDRKEYCFSQFAIEMDKPDRECYSPGEIISGKIILEVNTKVEIRFVELLIVGLATIHFGKNDPHHGQNSPEVIINKRSYIMGTPDGRWNSVITEGKYVSKFKFILPNDIPSSIKYENKEHGFSFEIGYLVKARICDELGSSSTRSTHSINTLVKVLLSRKHAFFVRRPFDIHAIPNAMKPVNHTEFINLNCLPIALDSAMVRLSLDRSVFLAGDVIRVQLSTTPGTARKIKHLTCQLQQRMTSSVKPKATYALAQIDEHEPEGVIVKQPNVRNTVSFDFMIPTHSQYIPTYLQGCKLIKVSYYVTMMVKFNACAGQLMLEAPIAIGPCNDTQNVDQLRAVPVFNRPIRFPHFSKDNNGKVQNGTIHSGVPGNQVTSEHKQGGRSFLRCCVDDA